MKLKISVNEIESILLQMPKFPENPKLIFQLQKGEHFEISNKGQVDEALFYKNELINLLKAPLGLNHCVSTSDLTKESKFDIEIEKPKPCETLLGGLNDQGIEECGLGNILCEDCKRWRMVY